MRIKTHPSKSQMRKLIREIKSGRKPVARFCGFLLDTMPMPSEIKKYMEAGELEYKNVYRINDITEKDGHYIFHIKATTKNIKIVDTKIKRYFEIDPNPQLNELVTFDYKRMPIEYHKHFPFKDTDTLVFLGEVRQMPGHCIVSNIKTGQIYSCHHTEEFIPLPDDEA